jgi:SH3-like domain-containing protein
LAGQASKNYGRTAVLAAVLWLMALGLEACGEQRGEGKDCDPAARISAISGFCVPRYVSLKRDKVYARKGPGTDYPALWIYQAKGLPVQVVGETLDWRRVCDPDGGAVWVHRSMVDGRRTVQVRGPAPIPLLSEPRDGARVEGLVQPRALASLGRCQGEWCKLSVGGVTGWATNGHVWGVAPQAQCH